MKNEHWNTVIIGAGQAGLATAYFLKKFNNEFIILDKFDKIGEAWRKRWESLMLFTPSQYDGLPGFPFPDERDTFPDRNHMASYLQDYAARFSLPVNLNVNVSRLFKSNSHFEIESSSGRIISDKVVVATGTHPLPRIPVMASGLSGEIFQIHSSEYMNSDSLPTGDILVVGAGTSGIEIALEISKSRNTMISGNPTMHIPEALFKYGGNFFWWFINNIITVKTPMGRKAKEKLRHGGSPLIKISAADLDKANIRRVPRVSGVRNGKPELEDGTVLNVSGIIWATGYRPDFSWIDPDVTDESGWPITNRGISLITPGLYFNGMPFQFGLTSGLVGGVGRDAKFISEHIRRS